MSLSVEIRVNGHPVATLTAHNNGYVVGKDTTCRYSGVITGQTIKGTPYAGLLSSVMHDRTDGILALAYKLLKATGFPDKQTPIRNS